MTTNRTAEIAKAREVDERIAQEWDKYWEALQPVTPALRQIKESETSLKRNRERLAAEPEGRNAKVYALNIEHYEKAIEQAEVVIDAAHKAAEPFAQAAKKIDREEYTGWTRFYLVKHIHRSQHCSSFRENTRIGWLPDVSGLTEAEAVAEHGAILCTICFPSAPTEWTAGPKADPDVCTGTRYERRIGMGGICAECGNYVAFKSYSNASPRKHKKQK